MMLRINSVVCGRGVKPFILRISASGEAPQASSLAPQLSRGGISLVKCLKGRPCNVRGDASGASHPRIRRTQEFPAPRLKAALTSGAIEAWRLR